MDWILGRIADRIGGAYFEAAKDYKFNVIHALKEAAQLKHPDVPCLDFGIGEPDEKAADCIIRTLQQEVEKSENRFYANNGASFFKEAIRDYMDETFAVNLNSEEEILPVLGIKSGLSLLAGTLINPGDYVLVTSPGYPVFATQARYYGGQVLELPLLPENHFLPDFEQIPKEMRKRIKVCCLNYPNNPTGAVATHAFFEKAIEWAQRYRWVLLNDAAYSVLSFEKPLSLLSLPGARTCALELHSMSKGFNMTGWRIGWICGHKTLVKACAKMKNNTDSGIFLAIQKAAVCGLQNAKTILPVNCERYQRRLQALQTILEKVGFQCFTPKAGFFLYVKAPKRIIHRNSGETFVFSDAFSVTRWLLEQLHILTVPWDEVGSFLRFSVTFEASEATFFKVLKDRLEPYFFDYK